LSKNDNDTRFGSGVGRRRGKRERMEVDYLEGQFLLLGSHVQDLVHTWELVFAYVLKLERESLLKHDPSGRLTRDPELEPDWVDEKIG
jgi:hypothetical protein